MTAVGQGSDIEPIAIESYDTAMITCPYYQGVTGGRCVSGCWEEPRCQTDEPHGGWRVRDQQGRFMPASREQLRATAEARLDDYRTRRPSLNQTTTSTETQ
ncbi:hypothetical protein HCA61_22130 [Rhodococcus sp. HNM0563]|uniref:hypothetical protein n=1 Tax=Rhodococcus sp. HNM0563 TaxID=2716339 RepID=UPI00146B203F|nr:hypothetical protein [Rhodococcus sp. HNM0563]NLU64939.1 hypothetical protein [Rhodococcus sp. HNM0563]